MTQTMTSPEVSTAKETMTTADMTPAVMTTQKVLAPPGCLMVTKGDFVPWDNPDMLISKEADLWISTVVIGSVVLPTLLVLGVVGNILSLAVFWRQGLRDRVNLCLFTLAAADILVLLSNVLLTCEKVYRDLVGFSAFFITYFPGITGVTWVTQFLSAVIASERCFCVVSPLHAKRFLKTSTMAAFIYVTSALLLGGMLAIAGPKHTAVCMFDPATNKTEDMVYVTQYYLDHKAILDVVDVFLYATALPFLFLTVVCLTTAVTAVKLAQATTWRRATASTGTTRTAGRQPEVNEKPEKKKEEAVGSVEKLSAKEAALTRMLVATSVLFIVCLVPILMVQVATFLEPELNYGRRQHNLTSVLWQAINAFRCLNASMNFYIYCRMGSKFRQTLFQLLPCCGSCYGTVVGEMRGEGLGEGKKMEPRGQVQSQTLQH